MPRILPLLIVVLSLSLPQLLSACQDGPAQANQAQANQAQSDRLQTAPMDNVRMGALIKRLDDQAKGRPGLWQLTIKDHQLTIITDRKANRMRIVAPVVRTGALDKGELYRLMQANFDSALDARYAIAKDVLWSTFIHPLTRLNDQQFLSGIGQVVNLIETFGSTYSSGELVFGGGDSADLRRRALIDELIERGTRI